ncbi:hypothetical protein [Halorhodospira halophila]|uniref:Uncharacterized protein n=1 Tax=Halorhodospira halophila (strain DSM 244 / SL1) TaxID=349124 RepID=A1WZ34_HALHL|nr:hypothetical protein [Halorhodospira halophila]ABM62946.1 hypothetical protein Hhal_2182 [Halorhodospira halophila SL1]MBK1727933.1 hypothetical protein [Halorhodospira halophila]
MERLLPEELIRTGSRIAERLRQRSVCVPIPERAMARTVTGANDPSLRHLTLRISEGGRIVVSGEKKKGVWIPFSVTFIAVAPPPGTAGPSVELHLERTSPFFAAPFVLRALGRMPEMEIIGNRARVRVDHWIDQQGWAESLPTGMFKRVRVTEVDTDPGNRQLLVTLGLAGG